MSIRRYDFVTDVETSAQPTPTPASNAADLATYGQIQDEFAKRPDWGDDVASLAALKAIAASGAGGRFDGQRRTVKVSGVFRDYVFDAASSATGDDDLVVTPTSGTGRWIRVIAPVPEIQDESSTVATSYRKIDFQGTGVTASLIGDTVQVSVTGGGGGGGASGAGEDPLRVLLEAEASPNPEIELPFQFIDDFADTGDAKGTKTDMSVSNSGLVFNAGETVGRYQRDRITNAELKNCTGVATLRLASFAPKATTITVAGNDRTIVFNNDVTSFFPVGKKIIAIRKYLSSEPNTEGVDKFLPRVSSTTGLVTYEILSSSYDAGTNETEVVATSTNASAIDFGLSASDYPTKLRFAPFNYSFRVNALHATPTDGQYEAMQVERCIGTDEVFVAAELVFEALSATGFDGSKERVLANKSRDGKYQAAIIRENEATDQYHFFYSKDFGVTWAHLGSKSTGAALDDEIGSTDSAVYGRPDNIAIANNGKCFFVYAFAGANRHVRGNWANLSDSSPALSADITGDTAGSISADVASSVRAISCSIEPIDGEYVQVSYIRTDDILYGRAFDWTLSSPSYNSGSNFSQGTIGAINGLFTVVTKVSGSFYSWNFARLNAGTLTGYRAVRGSSSLTTITVAAGSNLRYFGFFANATHLLVGVYDAGSGVPVTIYRYGIGSLPTTPTGTHVLRPASSAGLLNEFGGWTGLANINLIKNFTNRICSKPDDDNHVFVTYDYRQPDNTLHTSETFEIRNITDYQGIHQSQLTTDTDRDLRDASARTSLAFSFTANTSRVRSIGIRMRMVNTITTGTYVRMKIFSDSAGVPGTELYAGINTYDPKKITTASTGEWLWFNFNNVSLTNGVVYHMVVEADYTIGSNVLRVLAQAANTFTGGESAFNGTTWSTTTSNDWVLAISGEWTFRNCDQRGMIAAVSPKNIISRVCESQIAAVNSLNGRFTFRVAYLRHGSDNDMPITGHTFQKVFEWGSSNEASTFQALQPVGYLVTQFDENLVWSVGTGRVASGRQNLTTGAVDANERFEDRSGMTNILSDIVGAPTVATSGDFISDWNTTGIVTQWNGTQRRSYATDMNAVDLYSNRPFAIEFAVKFSGGLVNGNTFISTMNSLSQGGFIINPGVSNAMRITLRNSSGTIIAETNTAASYLATGQYYQFRISYDGAGGQVRIFRATTPTGSFTEASYGTVTNFSSGNTAGVTTVLRIGSNEGGTTYLTGDFEYLKMINGSNTFAYRGWYPQAATVSAMNLGPSVLLKQVNGQNATTIGTNYNDADVAVSASDEISTGIAAYYNHTLASPGQYMHYRLDAERMNTDDSSLIRGTVANFSE